MNAESEGSITRVNDNTMKNHTLAYFLYGAECPKGLKVWKLFECQLHVILWHFVLR
jgi:hypothetical protein